MTVIGITGPTGAGKTTVLNVLRELGGAAADGVGLPLQEEAQLHKAFPAGGGAVAPEVLALAGGAAGLAVEGEGDGVKEGGFSRPGGAADEENPAFPGGGKIQGLFLPVGSKGA